MKIFITGIAGVLGSNLARMLISHGHSVRGCDIIRKNEAWRLGPILDKIDYLWKSTNDLDAEVKGADIIIDCGLGFADRPFANDSPISAAIGNILPPLCLLERIRKMPRRPVLIYPSSFNSLYGHVGATFVETMSQFPTSTYGWTKASVEQLYTVYRIMYDLPVVLTRVGSAYGEQMRSDELMAKLIIHSLLGKRKFYLRSPRAKRLWTHIDDVLSFYRCLLSELDSQIGETLHCAGNLGDRILENAEIAKMIVETTGTHMEIIEGEYEPGETVFGTPIHFSIDSNRTRKVLGWKPCVSLEVGIERTVDWFKANLWRFS